MRCAYCERGVEINSITLLCKQCMNNDVKIGEKNKEDIINKPNHYHEGIQPIEVMESNFDLMETRGFLKGNVIKYVCRSNKKGKELEDLKKAQWNLNKLIEKVENEIHDRGK